MEFLQHKRVWVTGTLIGVIVFLFLGKLWMEDQQENAPLPVTASSDGVIPADAIRLRIIANSDSPADQQLKLQVRDEIIQEVAAKLQGKRSPEEARQAIQENLAAFNDTAVGVLRSKGSSYSVRTDYGDVPFPTKLYGDRVYPAGHYEALRITIGAGAGQNWWCVLFPPLCFVDLAHGDAVPKDMAQHKTSQQSGQGKTIGTATVETATGKTAFQLHFALLDVILAWLHRI